jgi:hypothetical protein
MSKKIRKRKTSEFESAVALAPNFDELRQKHAERFADGETSRVSTIRLELDWIRKNGALVDVDVVGLSMLTCTVRLSELGFPDEIALATIGQVIMNLADAGLLPEWILSFNRRTNSVSMALCRPVYLRSAKSIESQVRQQLAAFSYRKGMERVLGPYYWIPVTAYAAWKSDFDQRQAALEEVKAHLVNDLVAWEHEIAAGWRLIAREAYAAITRRVPFTYGEEAFTDRLVQAVARRLPTAEQIQGGIRLEYSTPVLLTPSEVEADLARRDAIAHQRELEYARVAEIETEHRARARVVDAESFEQARLLRVQTDAEAQIAWERAEYERRRLRAMHEAELEHARRQIAEMESPFQQVIESLRADIYETVQHVLASIQKHGHVRGKSAEQARNMIATFQLLNVAGDEELERLLGDLGQALDRPGAETARDAGAIADALTALARETVEAAQAVARRLEPSQAALIEI